MAQLRGSQAELLARLEASANLEDELMQSFRQRQNELERLDALLGERAGALRALIEQAGEVSRSPRLLREIIINGSQRGCSLGELAKKTGLSVDEVELVLAQSER